METKTIKEEKNIYNLELHEILHLNAFNEVERVASGWIYTNWSNEGDCKYAVFVPFDNRFAMSEQKKSRTK